MDFLDKDSDYHIDVVRSKLMRDLPTILQDIHDELLLALNDFIPTVGKGMPQPCGKPFASS